jgi:hypothetical protein
MLTEKEKRRIYRLEHRAEIYAYTKAWIVKNKEKSRGYALKYYRRDGKARRQKHKAHYKRYMQIFRTSHPWYKTYYAIRARCCYPACPSYKYYGAKGIQNFLSINDLKMLWFRDKAYLMIKPSIDRHRTWDNYTLENCEYIEMALNRVKDRNKERGLKPCQPKNDGKSTPKL